MVSVKGVVFIVIAYILPFLNFKKYLTFLGATLINLILLSSDGNQTMHTISQTM